jgi:hypothetical protein
MVGTTINFTGSKNDPGGSGLFYPLYAAKNADELESDSIFLSAFCERKKMFRSRGTIGCASISRRGGLHQGITDSAQMAVTVFN